MKVQGSRFKDQKFKDPGIKAQRSKVQGSRTKAQGSRSTNTVFEMPVRALWPYVKNLRIICQGVPVNHKGKGLSTQRISKILGEKGPPA